MTKPLDGNQTSIGVLSQNIRGLSIDEDFPVGVYVGEYIDAG